MSVSETPRVITKSDPTQLVIEWADSAETTLTTPQLRAVCPCAHCVDELTGRRVHDPSSVPAGLVTESVALIGHYALAIRFSDGHDTGIYTFEMLRRAGESASGADPEST
jgi:ATP-binding protein involved in chromosome partitioning